MLGAIFGDIAGSVYEFANTHDYDFQLLSGQSRPTDDSYMTLAVAKALMETYGEDDDVVRAALVKYMQEIGNKYPFAGYGGRFRKWLHDKDPRPYGSCGNGSGMRVAAAGWLYQTLEETLHMAAVTADVTHDHPEGLIGAQAIAAAIFLARAGAAKEEIASYIEKSFGYDLSRTLDEIRPTYGFYAICQKSCPEAVIAFLEGENYEDVIRKAISLGGDSDTIACMAGAIAEAFYGMPEAYKKEVLSRLDAPMRKIVKDFHSFYRQHSGKPHEGWREAMALKEDESDVFLQMNPLIEERLEAYYRAGETGEGSGPVFEAILQAMALDGHMLIPVEMDDASYEETGDELHWKLIHLDYEDGNRAMPVFTSAEKLRQTGLNCSILSVFLDDYMTRVLEMKDVQGIIINPVDQGFFLNRHVIKSILQAHQEAKTKMRTVEKDAQFMIPENVPEGFEEVMGDFVRNSLSDYVNRVWFTGLSDGGENSWLFAIDSDVEDIQQIFDRFHTMMIMMKIKMPVDYMAAAERPWPFAKLIYEKE